MIYQLNKSVDELNDKMETVVIYINGLENQV